VLVADDDADGRALIALAIAPYEELEELRAMQRDATSYPQAFSQLQRQRRYHEKSLHRARLSRSGYFDWGEFVDD
jgi:hypothetical protein